MLTYDRWQYISLTTNNYVQNDLHPGKRKTRNGKRTSNSDRWHLCNVCIHRRLHQE